ncbi:hypothetical protein BDV59DRAFT_210465 [Aspergillus ambiguus]|uniref:type I polyketide synthase n=1 Tax=Aspergillus ambiguus TaxID=176160 RepID=UPI003CCD4128
MTKIFYFNDGFPTGDRTHVFQLLRVCHKSPRHVFLRLICQEATIALREVIRELPVSMRSSVPPFSSILDLAESYDWIPEPLNSALRGVLICMIQLGLFVCYHELYPREYNFSGRTTSFTGVGFGLLAAATVLGSPTLADLPRMTAEAIRIALRLGIRIHDTASAIERRHSGQSVGKWATSLKDIGEKAIQGELDQFNVKLGCPGPSRVYLSVTGGEDVVLSGPPSKLRLFLESSGRVKDDHSTELPVYGPYHAPHLYNESQVAKITESLDSLPAYGLTTGAVLLSIQDGRPIRAKTVPDLFRHIVSEILTCTVSLGQVTEHAIRSASATPQGHKCSLYAFELGNTVKKLVSALQEQTPEVEAWDLTEWMLNQIAIVGMSCRFPGGSNDLDSFWDVLESGRDVHQNVPADRYDVEGHTDPTETRPNTSKTPFGCFIDNPGLFDCSFFDMSPREAEQTDPMHRLALVTAYEALEASGYVPDRTMSTNRNRIGTFYGQASDDYREVNAGQTIDTYFIPGGCRAFAPGRINYFFKFSGPSFSCDTACSASLATVQLACTSLLHGDVDMVVAGGLNILTNSDNFAGLSRGHFLSPTGGCKVFDANADGYCRADGIGSIVLKRLTEAEHDNDNILGVILASATNHSANAVSITHPHAPTQAQLFRHVLRTAGVSPLDVDMVEMHGTGTQAGDKEEMESVTSVFAPASPGEVRTNPLYVTSVKGNVGHGEAAAGITALIKVLLIFQKGIIPRHVGIKGALNPKLPDLARLNVYIPTKSVPWVPNVNRKRYAMVNNFSAAGGNTSILLEEPPVRPDKDPCPSSTYVITVSGKGTAALQKNLSSMIAYLEAAGPSLDIPSLSYTTTSRRIHHSHRVAVVGSNTQEISRALRQSLSRTENHSSAIKSAPSVAFVFSGQGSFYLGMGQQLFEQYPPYRQQIQHLDALSVLHGFPSIIPLIINDQALQAHEVGDPLLTQLATVIVEIALYNLWTRVGITPSVVVGASLGEFAALYAAGVISASDVLFLVGHRALLMKEVCTLGTHAMLAVQANLAEINHVLKGQVYEVACVNGPHDLSVTAPVDEIPRAQRLLEEAGFKSTILNVPFAYHSSQMEPLLDRLEAIAQTVQFQTPSVPILSSVRCCCITSDGVINSSYIRDATRNPVLFNGVLNEAKKCGLVDTKTAWLEIGPHLSYTRFVRAAMPEVPVAASMKRDEDNWRSLACAMAELYNSGISIDWGEWNRPFEARLHLLPLPRYGWNEKNYWIQYEGDWALHKGRSCADTGTGLELCPPTLRNCLVHYLVKEAVSGSGGELIIRSNILQPDFFEVLNSHRIGGNPVATSTIHYYMAVSMASYLYTRIKPASSVPGLDLSDFVVHKSLVARVDRSKPQLIEVRAVADLNKGFIHVYWYNVEGNGESLQDKPFATGVLSCCDRQDWLDSWSTSAHLVGSRIKVLNQMADQGTASRLDEGIAYMLLRNLVDTSGPYRGIKSVVVRDMEAAAEVTLAPHVIKTGNVAPYHLDSLLQPAGVLLNGGNAEDNRDFIHIPPSWKSIRLAKPLIAGSRYRSYTKITPVRGEHGRYTGDIYILEADEIIGLVSSMMYVRYPRIALSMIFAPPDLQEPEVSALRTRTPATVKHREASHTCTSDTCVSRDMDTPNSGGSFVDANSTIAQAIGIIAKETRIELSQLTDETQLSSIGLDSLLSLVVQQKFSVQLNLQIPTVLFMESETVGNLKAFLADYC